MAECLKLWNSGSVLIVETTQGSFSPTIEKLLKFHIHLYETDFNNKECILTKFHLCLMRKLWEINDSNKDMSKLIFLFLWLFLWHTKLPSAVFRFGNVVTALCDFDDENLLNHHWLCIRQLHIMGLVNVIVAVLYYFIFSYGSNLLPFTGIIREMVHRHGDGSFSVWGTNPNYPSSTWWVIITNFIGFSSPSYILVGQELATSSNEIFY